MFEFLSEIPSWVNGVTGLVTACTAITALTPTKSDDAAINVVLKVLNFLSGNIGKNRNADGYHSPWL